MDKVYECELSKKNELKKILEAEPYAEDSFARVGYKLKDGTVVGEDKEKTYLCISASEEFFKKTEEKLKDLVKPVEGEVASRILSKIEEEEESVASGVAMFGE